MTSTIAPAPSPHGMVESPAAAIASRLHRSSTGRGGPLSDARAQFDAASRLIGLDPALHAVLSVPQRELTAMLPARLPDGRTVMVAGHRVQHSLARGPGKGGILQGAGRGGSTASTYIRARIRRERDPRRRRRQDRQHHHRDEGLDRKSRSRITADVSEPRPTVLPCTHLGSLWNSYRAPASGGRVSYPGTPCGSTGR